MKENGLKVEKANGKPKKFKDEDIVESENQKPQEKSKVIEENEEKQQNLNEQVGKKPTINHDESKFDEKLEEQNFTINLRLDLMSLVLFVLAAATRFYRLAEPKNVVFDEIHYGRYVSLYLRNTFFFEKHPPFGKQLIAGVANLAGYDGNFTFSRIGSQYTPNVPIFWLRFVPALCGSLLPSSIYNLLKQLRINRWTSALGGLLIIFDNALLTQSRFILMEPMLLLFSICALIFLLKFIERPNFSAEWWYYGILSASCFAFAMSIKYVAFYTYCLGGVTVFRHLWNQTSNKSISDLQLMFKTVSKGAILMIIPLAIYAGLFYIHLGVLYKAGPHDSVMTSAFQASLEGGLASITHGQPLKVVHGSQITLRHTNGRACWLHSHAHVYPVRYDDKRGSSHQQQVSCYSFKDVNNWWIIKRPEKPDFSVGDEIDPIKHGEEIQLVHGISSRPLNSHDVAAPVSPSSQEVSCYIDYNVSMPAQILWRVDIINKNEEGEFWHAIKSHVRFIHVTTGTVLRFTGRQLPAWGFNQHEVAADKNMNHPDNVWNVEEHRYTKTSDQKERERQLMKHEMIPTEKTQLTFWQKFSELQKKMFWQTDTVQNHMYSSDPTDWPFLNKGIAYWYRKDTNAQIHLLGNILLWYSATFGLFIYFGFLVLYLLRRRRLVHDLPETEWNQFQNIGYSLFFGYLVNYIPYFFTESTLFLHNYLPALVFKICLLCYVIDHIYLVCKRTNLKYLINIYKLIVMLWVLTIIYVFKTFTVLSYGSTTLTAEECLKLRWKDTWDFIFS